MASDAHWVEDVRRWYLAGTQAVASAYAQDAADTESAALGYEAADPALQARNWPDAPGNGFEPQR